MDADDETEPGSRATSPAPSQAESEISAAPSFITSGGRRSSRSPSVASSDTTTSTYTASGRRKYQNQKLKRQLDKNPSIYDLAAGKVRRKSRHANYGFGGEVTVPYPPVEFYFDRKRVKTGDEDEDSRLYWRREVDKHKLPPSDLLWAIHRNASQFFSKKGDDHLKFMDESALLAVGVLLEETMKQSLGKSGHLAFLEPDDEHESTGADRMDESDDQMEDDNDDSGATDQDSDDGRENSADQKVSTSRPARGLRLSKKALAKGYTLDDYLTD